MKWSIIQRGGFPGPTNPPQETIRRRCPLCRGVIIVHLPLYRPIVSIVRNMIEVRCESCKKEVKIKHIES